MKKSNKTSLGSLKASRGRKSIFVILAILLAVVLLYIFLLKPAMGRLAVKYIEQGDQHLLNNEYLIAMVNYQKARWLDKNSEASSRIDLSHKIQLDYQQSKNFLQQNNADAALESLANAEAVPTGIKAGISEIQNYLGENQPYLAEIIAQSLVEMDSGNSNTWLYLGISRFQSARIMQMTVDGRQQKLASAKEAFNQAASIDNSDSLATKYLDEINKML